MAVDLSALYANLPASMVDAQKMLEASIQAYGDAVDVEAQAEYEYRTKKAEVIRRLREEKMPVGMAVDLAQGETADLKRSVMQAEGAKKKCAYLIDGYRERLFNLRHIGNSISKNNTNL